MANPKSCGSLHCQRDSYARSLDSVVVSCEPSQAKDHQGKYELVLEDTVLFPEGGGQVCGHGITMDEPSLLLNIL